MTHGRDTPSASGAAPDNAGFLASVLDIVRRRLPLIAATAGGFLGLAGVWIAHQPFVYRAEAIIDLAPRSTQLVKLDELVERFNPNEGAIGTELSYLRSRAFREQVLTRLRDAYPVVYQRLRDDRATAPSFADRFYDVSLVAYARRELGGYIAQLQAGEPEPETDGAGAAPEAIPAVAESGRAAGHDPALMQEVGRRLAIERLEKSSPVLGMSFSAHDPELAATLANLAAELYVGSQTTSKEATFERARIELDREAQSLKGEIEKIEAEIQRLQDRIVLVSQDGPGLLQQEASAATQELLAARSQRKALAEQLNLFSSQRDGVPAAALVTGLMPLPVLEELRTVEAALARRQAEIGSEFGPRHPRMAQLAADREHLEQRIELEVEAAIARARQGIQVLSAREADIEKRLGQLQSKDADSRRIQVEIRELERRREARTRLLEVVLARQKETQLQAGMIQSDTRLLSPAAVSVARESPKLTLLLSLDLMASLLLGCGAALIAEQLDQRLRTAEQVAATTGLGVLAWLPQVDRRTKPFAPVSYLHTQPVSIYAEAVRNLRLAVQKRLLSEGGRIVGISSSRPEEGKTVLAHSLAYSFAAAGASTVLVELDLRKPNLGRQMGVRVEAGIEDYLSGLAGLDQVLHRSPLSDRLAYVPVRGQPRLPADLIEAPQLGELLQALVGRFERVVVDLPPVMQLADAPAAAESLDAVLFVVRWNKTDGSTAEMAVSRLRDAPAKILGAAFTRVDLAASRRHGASNPYRDHAAYRAYYRE